MIKRIVYSIFTALFLSILFYIICDNVEKKYYAEYRKEKDEFETNWMKDTEQKKKAILDLRIKITTMSITSPYWLEYREDYLQRAENSGIDLSSRMFDKMIINLTGFSIVVDFIKSYYHRDSPERELLRELESPSLDYDVRPRFPYHLVDFLYFKKHKTDNPIFTEEPIVVAVFVFVISLVISFTLSFIYKRH